MRNTSLDLFPGTGEVPGIAKGVRLRGWRWVWPQLLRIAYTLSTLGLSYPVSREFPEGLSRTSLGLSEQKPATLGVKH